MMKNIRLLVVAIFLSLMQSYGIACTCDMDSIYKIEILSSRGVFTAIEISRFAWIPFWNGLSRDRIIITNKNKVSEIMTSLCEAEKEEDLDFGVNDPAVILRDLGGRGITAYESLVPEIRGMMLIYRYGCKEPEIIWIYIDVFDREKARYKLPNNFWDSIKV